MSSATDVAALKWVTVNDAVRTLPPVRPAVTPVLDPRFRPAALAWRAFEQRAPRHRAPGPGRASRSSRDGGAVSQFAADLHARERARRGRRTSGCWSGWSSSRCGPTAATASTSSAGRAGRAGCARTFATAPTGRFDSEIVGERVYGHPDRDRGRRTSCRPSARARTALGGHLDGCRIGFDLGGSDRKVAAIIDGRVVCSEETEWDPYHQPDPQYHWDGIMDSLRRAADAPAARRRDRRQRRRRLRRQPGEVRVAVPRRARPTCSRGACGTCSSISARLERRPVRRRQRRRRDRAARLDVAARRRRARASRSAPAPRAATSPPTGASPLAERDRLRPHRLPRRCPARRVVGRHRLLRAVPVAAGGGASAAGRRGIELSPAMPLPAQLKRGAGADAGGDPRAARHLPDARRLPRLRAGPLRERLRLPSRAACSGAVTTGPGGDVMLDMAREVLRADFPELAARVIAAHARREGEAPRPGHRRRQPAWRATNRLSSASESARDDSAEIPIEELQKGVRVVTMAARARLGGRPRRVYPAREAGGPMGCAGRYAKEVWGTAFAAQQAAHLRADHRGRHRGDGAARDADVVARPDVERLAGGRRVQLAHEVRDVVAGVAILVENSIPQERLRLVRGLRRTPSSRLGSGRRRCSRATAPCWSCPTTSGSTTRCSLNQLAPVQDISRLRVDVPTDVGESVDEARRDRERGRTSVTRTRQPPPTVRLEAIEPGAFRFSWSLGARCSPPAASPPTCGARDLARLRRARAPVRDQHLRRQHASCPRRRTRTAPNRPPRPWSTRSRRRAGRA